MAASIRHSIKSSTLQYETLSTNDSKQRDVAKIRDHFFNFGVTLILPGVNTVPNQILECLTDQLSYKLEKLPIYHLLEIPFIQAFVKRGAIHLMSVNRRLHTNDTVVLTPSGILILTLTKDTYEQLGLEAEKQNHIHHQNKTFVVKINLLERAFHPGKKGYDRTLWCLKDRLDLVFDCLISWDPHDKKLCSSSVGVYFMEKCHQVTRIDLKKASRNFTSLPCPKLDAKDPEGSEIGCQFNEFFEWMGALACDIQLRPEDASQDNFVTTMSCPELVTNLPRCCVFQASGFLTSNTILQVWRALREHTSQNESYPTSLTVHGFNDCPVNKKSESHYYYVTGDNIYSLVLLPEGMCCIYTATGF
ncbi:unnamed protein product [Lymnaea stagnalis]|uniref:Uncharacterized protein n=1 Tax=Lymnaea stagnalis TaxID=6523 RepID=A0AAV2HXZ2_LYMST